MNSTERLALLHSRTTWNEALAMESVRPDARRLSDVRVLALMLILGAPLLFAAVAVALGKEAGWDFQNYHWYDPFAYLNGRLGFDIAVAHHATYYNPFSDLPLYWIATHAPAWVAGAYMGALFGAAVVLLGAIAYHTLAIANPYGRLATAAALAVAGSLGGGAFPAIGNTSNDVPVALGIFAGLLILVRSFTRLRTGEFARRLAVALLAAGICAGASIGFKLTTMVYAMGLCAFVGVAARGWRKRMAGLVVFGAGLGLGALLCGGYWMLRMWQYGGNPVFPYFNQWFRSPLLIDGSFRDPSFIPDNGLTAWLFPFFFTADSHYVAEWSFRDAHILAAYLLLPLTAVLIWAKRTRQDGPVAAGLALPLFAFAAVSYLAWMFMFGVYRYLIPLEMLAPLLIAAAILLWPMRTRLQIAAIAALLVVLQLCVKITNFRQPWDAQYVAVETPTVAELDRGMVLLSGVSPMAYVIPAFPPQVPFLRIDGWLIQGDDLYSGLAREMRARVAQHRGPLFLLFPSYEDDRALAAAEHYALGFETRPCDLVRSNIGEPLKLCRLTRLANST